MSKKKQKMKTVLSQSPSGSVWVPFHTREQWKEKKVETSTKADFKSDHEVMNIRVESCPNWVVRLRVRFWGGQFGFDYRIATDLGRSVAIL